MNLIFSASSPVATASLEANEFPVSYPTETLQLHTEEQK